MRNLRQLRAKFDAEEQSYIVHYFFSIKLLLSVYYWLRELRTMSEPEARIISTYGNKLRIRVCGICIENESVLVVNHKYLNAGSNFWSPPGGGMEFGVSAEDNLKREVLEETGILIKVEKFMYVNEYLVPPLHAIELFFRISRIGGELKIGYDPELGYKDQIIKDVRFMKISEIIKMPVNQLHQVLTSLLHEDSSECKAGYGIFKN